MAEEETVEAGVAGRYATALYDLTQDSKSTDKVAADLSGFIQLLNDNADLERLVRSPAFSAEEQVRGLGAVLDLAGIGGVAANFLKLLATKRRLFAVRDIVAAYGRMNDARKGVIRAEITVAEPLPAARIDEIKTALRQVAGSQSVDVAVKIDPSIIGGMIAKLGSRMVDSSLRTKLNSIRIRMKEVG